MTASHHDRLLSERLEGWQPDHSGTLMFIQRPGPTGAEVLLMRKKRGHGAGRINGPGGKIDPGETPLEAAVRETREEVGVQVLEARLMGRFRFVDLTASQWLGYVFTASRAEGTPVETEEGDPAWYPVGGLPFAEMWDDDRYWLPRVLAGERLTGDFLFDDGRLLTHRLCAVADV